MWCVGYGALGYGAVPNGTLFVVCNNDQITYLLPEADALERGSWAPLGKKLNPGSCGDPDRNWEDGHLWFDARNNWHLLYHVFCLLPYEAKKECFTGHAFSADGERWTFSKTEPVGGEVDFSDGSQITFSTRERPKFVYSDANNMTTPVALITGVSASCSPPSAACCARCNRTVSGAPSEQPHGTCSQCKHGWQECYNGHCGGGSPGGMDYTYTVLQPLVGFGGTTAPA